MTETLPRGYDLEAARTRLKLAARGGQARFDLSAAGASALVPTSQLPPALAERFEVAARSRARVAEALGARPIPSGTGMTVSVASMDSGATVEIQATEGDAVSSTDPTFGLPSSAIGYAAGYVDASRQLVDRSAEGAKLDQVIARELGRAAGELIDQQLLNGSGSNGEIDGLLSLAGGGVTFTSASPTPAEFASAVGEGYAVTATSYGIGPDLLLWAPRRAAWALSQADTGDSVRRVLSLYGEAVEVPATPTALSGSQDAVIVLRREAVHAFADSRVDAHIDAASDSLAVRFKVTARVALVLGNAGAVTAITGTGLATPTFA